MGEPKPAENRRRRQAAGSGGVASLAPSRVPPSTERHASRSRQHQDNRADTQHGLAAIGGRWPNIGMNE